jgi:hypothetical protein
MSLKPTLIRKNEIKRLFSAALDAGFEAARVTIHPDGRIEATASFSVSAKNPNAENEWDDVLK